MKVAVVGAGGFVGSTLCERLFFEREFDFVPVIHSYGGSGRLARLPVPLQVADVLDAAQLTAALQGCDAIVNCSRGDGIVMDRGLRNLLDAARKNGITRIVHISSIAIYGNNPPPESEDEATPPVPNDEYGVWKADQDGLLMKAAQSGMKVVMLCPANIYGPYSPFIAGAADYVRRGSVLLVDGGRNPTNNVHVNNIVEAIVVALKSDAGWGQRYFVNEPERVTWRQFYEDLGAIVGVKPEFRSVSSEAVRAAAGGPPPKPTLVDNVKILCSGEFRRALSIVPAFGAVNDWAYRSFSRVDPGVQQRLRSRLSRPTYIPKQRLGPDLTQKYVREQIKPIYHSPARIMRTLGFQPFSYREGMSTVADWLSFVAN
jgi:nucleoside-diphosphate-sugar epimerase